MNLLIAAVFLLLIKLIDVSGVYSSDNVILVKVVEMLDYSAQINVLLFVLNLLPFPNFDGYHVITNLFNTWKYRFFNLLEQYGMIIFILLAVSGVLGWVLNPLVSITYGFLKFMILR